MPKKLKILFISPSLRGGGSERIISLLVNNFDTEKFDITLVVVDNQEQFYQIDTNRVRLINLKTPFIKHVFPKIFRLLWREKPDVVFSNMTKLNIFMATFRPFFPQKIRFVARESNIVSVDNAAAFPPRQLKFINGLIRHFYPRFDQIVCQSLDMKADLIDFYKQNEAKITVINNPVNVAAVQKQIEPRDRDMSKPHFVTVGRLATQKGFNRLLEAVSQLPMDFQFDIIGSGGEYENLNNLAKKLKISDKVRFLGQLKSPFSIVAASDVFIFGSHYEGFPNVLIEAGACGVPIVVFLSKSVFKT